MTSGSIESSGEAEGSELLVRRVYSEVGREYAALRSSAMLVDRSERSRGVVRGARAREVLNGLVTNEILALPAGAGRYAAALTPKGKIISDGRFFAREEDVWLDVPSRAATAWWAMVRKYVNPRLARYADESAARRDLSVYGVRAAAIVSSALGIAEAELSALELYGHREVDVGGSMSMVARVPDLGLDGFTLWVPTEGADALAKSLVHAGAEPGGEDAFAIARIEAGRPEWGVDMDDSTLAQEANMEELQAISYTKGCYTGQETVARVHFRGHVNRMLRGLRFGGLAPAVRAELFDDAGKQVGEVRSVAHSPRLGGIALAMVRREIEPESDVTARWVDGETRVRVATLPLSDD
jgi:folate-binding protein YgfZ